ncbi:sporulation inhibitor of replication protein SirA [Rossellomorea sp. H39__3]
MLTIHAWGTDESEYIFFEILRRHMGYLLAVDIQNERFGWLKPIKQRKFIY